MKAILFLLLTLISCNSTNQITGYWLLDIELQENQNLPAIIYLEKKDNKLTGWLQNSDEKINLVGTIKDSKFQVDIGAHYSLFEGTVDNNQLSGHWVRTNKDNYRVSFKGTKTSKEHLFKSYEEHENLNQFSGNWKIKFSEDRFGLGLFQQIGSRVKGSILTETGDYRYLDGHISENTISLYGFDGVFAFVFEFLINNDELKGVMFSGNSSKKDLSGIKDDTYKLSDPHSLTTSLSKAPLKIKKKTIEGEDFNLADYGDKVKVIQIFGSWCPNCIDETNFFLKWRIENPVLAQKVEFVAFSFEKAATEKIAINNLKKFKAKMNMDYPMILSDFNNTVKPEDIFPIDKTLAFPTTIFLDKMNRIVKIHTGFSGQATGAVFENYTDEFQSLILSLVKE